MSYIGKLEITYEDSSTKTYPILRPSAGKDALLRFKAVDWGKTTLRLVYAADPSDLDIPKILITIDVDDFAQHVGVEVEDPVAPDLANDIHSVYQVPLDGDTHDHVLSTQTAPGWTLKVSVRKKVS